MKAELTGWIVGPEHEEAIRIIERQRPEQHAIDDAEDGRVCADPKASVKTAIK